MYVRRFSIVVTTMSGLYHEHERGYHMMYDTHQWTRLMEDRWLKPETDGKWGVGDANNNRQLTARSHRHADTGIGLPPKQSVFSMHVVVSDSSIAFLAMLHHRPRRALFALSPMAMPSGVLCPTSETSVVAQPAGSGGLVSHMRQVESTTLSFPIRRYSAKVDMTTACAHLYHQATSKYHRFLPVFTLPKSSCSLLTLLEPAPD